MYVCMKTFCFLLSLKIAEKTDWKCFKNLFFKPILEVFLKKLFYKVPAIKSEVAY